MDKNTTKILSDLTVFSKYAKYVPELKRRETWEEICDRTKNMHIKRFPDLKDDINKAFELVKDKKVVPSMRSMQFGGKPIELNNVRLYNCSFTAIQTWKDFAEVMFLLLSGVGCSVSVQHRHIDKIPGITRPKKSKKFLVGDSIEGWSDSIRSLLKAYFYEGNLPLFDFSDVRQKGMPLITAGGKAPGPEPLERCLNKIKAKLSVKEVGSKLTPIEAHDIVCFIADAVLSGGIRRAAVLTLFDKNDEDMLNAKGNFSVKILNGGFHQNSQTKMYDGEVEYKNKAQFISLSKEQFREFELTKQLPWYYFEPQRQRSNNSIALLRTEVEKDEWDSLWTIIQSSGSGEPGVFWTNDLDWGTNPCAEVSLKSRQLCNLTEVNFSNVLDFEDLKERIWAATVLGTLQSLYTQFHYLSTKWESNGENEPLLGVSITGIGDNKNYNKYDWKYLANYVKEVNVEYAKQLGIKPAHRLTVIKPAGTSSICLGTSSGIHARFAKYYIRRMRYNKNEPIAQYLIKNHPELVEEEYGNSTGIVVSIPQKSPETSILRTEPALKTLERVKFFHDNWITPGHVKGANTNNVSCTVNIKPKEWQEVGEWMWDNRNSYNGIAVFPFDGGSYAQAPFEEITEELYLEMLKNVKDIDLRNVIEYDDNTDLNDQAACAGGSCELV